MFKNYERCTLCNRRKWLTTGCLRKWLKPLECKHTQKVDHKNDLNNTNYLQDHKIRNSIVFIKFWKHKFLLPGTKRTAQRCFGSKIIDREVNTNGFCTSLNGSDKCAGPSVAIDGRKDSEPKQKMQKYKCQHSEGHSVLRGHHQHTSMETCTIYCQLSKHGWYWGGITSGEAEELLAGQHDNVFLVRDSYDSKHILCVSFRCVGRTLHARLLHSNGLFSLNNETFVPANRISEHCSAVNVRSDLFEMPVKLARPLNRFARLDSLQMICRFVIRQTVPSNMWNKLPLPPDLINYVSKGSDYIVPS